MPPNLLAFVLFAIAASATPGPNNTLLAASAAAHGVCKTLPQVFGISLGFGAMVALVGLGLAGPLAASPTLHDVLRWVGGAWMLWIAYGIARSAVARDAQPRPPMSFVGAALFQWVNPKAWVLAVAATTTYTATAEPMVPQVLTLAAVFGLIGLPASLLWSLIGAGAARVLHTPRQLRAFNLVMAGLLALSILPLMA
ncbi:MAG: LysE family translocator [Janthinobacterium lividum]